MEVKTLLIIFRKDGSKEPIVEMRTEDERITNHEDGSPVNEPNETTPLTEPEYVAWYFKQLFQWLGVAWLEWVDFQLCARKKVALIALWDWHSGALFIRVFCSSYAILTTGQLQEGASISIPFPPNPQHNRIWRLSSPSLLLRDGRGQCLFTVSGAESGKKQENLWPHSLSCCPVGLEIHSKWMLSSPSTIRMLLLCPLGTQDSSGYPHCPTPHRFYSCVTLSPAACARPLGIAGGTVLRYSSSGEVACFPSLISIAVRCMLKSSWRSFPGWLPHSL